MHSDEQRLRFRDAMSSLSAAVNVVTTEGEAGRCGITATADPQRAAAYGQLQDLLVDEAAAFPLYERVWQAATAPRVRDFRWTAEGFAFLSDIQVGQP